MNRHSDHEQSSGLLSLGLSVNQKLKLEKDTKDSAMRKQNQEDIGFECTWAFWIFVLFIVLVSVIVSRYYYPSSIAKLDKEQISEISTLKSIYEHFSQRSHNKQNSQDEKTSQQQPFTQDQSKQSLIEPYEHFVSPYKLWLFVNSDLTHKDYIHNIEHYTSPIKSTIQLVTIQNYHELIKSATALKAIQKVNNLSLTKQQKEKLIQHLIVFCLLQQNGGIAIGGDLILTQELDKNIVEKIEENKDQYGMFLYFDQKNNQSAIDIDLSNYFVASGKHFDFITKIIPKMIKSLELQIASSMPSSQNLLKRYQDQFNEVFNLKFQQFSLSSQSKNGKSFQQFLQIYSLGSNRLLQISQPQLLNISNQNHFQYLSSYEEQPMEELVGALNPIIHLPSLLYSQFLAHIKNSQNHPILQNSFLYRHMLSFSSTYSTIKPFNPESDPQKYSPWKVPKILWTFINKIDQKSSLHDYFIANLMANAQQSGFDLMVLTEETIQVVLNEKEIHEIFSNFRNLQTQKNELQNQRILSQLIKLYILGKYGGVFVDFGYFLLENLNWISHIKSNDHIFNNIEKEPQVLMFHKNSVQQWSVNINSGLRTSANLHYMTGFIAAIKNSKLVANWLDTFLKNLKTFERVNSINEQNCNLDHVQRQYLVEASLQCILKSQIKTEQPTKELNNGFNIWSISGLLGGEKPDLVMKAQNEKCFDFKDSLFQFKSQYGSLGYVSELTTDVRKTQMNENLSYLEEDSIFKQFFINKNADRKKIAQTKSLKFVSERLQKIYK